MCILALAMGVSPRWRLVLAANRDELHARASAPLHAWQDAPGLLAGRDLVSGGGWLGVSRTGRACAVTNLRGEPPDPTAPSRGALVRDFLIASGQYAEPREADLARFNPFNLITIEGDRALFHTNRPAPRSSPLGPGVHGLSNGPLDEPAAKVFELNAALRAWLDAGVDDVDGLFSALRSEASAKAAGAAAAGVFMRNPRYGTRCSTVVLVAKDGQGLIMERRFAESGEAIGDARLTFAW